MAPAGRAPARRGLVRLTGAALAGWLAAGCGGHVVRYLGDSSFPVVEGPSASSTQTRLPTSRRSTSGPGCPSPKCSRPSNCGPRRDTA